jgi:hypothetical protein
MSTVAPTPQAPPPLTEAQTADMTRFVQQLTSSDSSLREAALLELSKKREDYVELPPLLWWAPPKSFTVQDFFCTPPVLHLLRPQALFWHHRRTATRDHCDLS